MPISRDMAIFVLTTTIQPITLPLAHAHGIKGACILAKVAVYIASLEPIDPLL